MSIIWNERNDSPRWGVIAFLLIGFIVVFTLIGFALSWGNEATRIAGPENSREQTTAILGDWQGLLTAADNACAAQRSARGGDDPTFVEDPAAAYAAVYYRIRSDYNRRSNNFFEGQVTRKFVGNLSGLPPYVPNLPEANGPNAQWCKVSDNLRNYHN